MKKIIWVLLLCPFLVSCGPKIYSGVYTYGLSQVDSPKLKSDRYGDIKALSEDSLLRYTYEDDYIRIGWLVSREQFDFRLHNKTSHTIRIIWDEASFVDLNGSSHRVIHSGIKFVDKNKPQPATVIPAGSYVDDLLVPEDNIYLPNIYQGWQTKSLVPSFSNEKEVLLRDAQSFIGKKLKIVLPVQIEDTTNDYQFTFDILNFVPGWETKEK